MRATGGSGRDASPVSALPRLTGMAEGAGYCALGSGRDAQIEDHGVEILLRHLRQIWIGHWRQHLRSIRPHALGNHRLQLFVGIAGNAVLVGVVCCDRNAPRTAELEAAPKVVSSMGPCGPMRVAFHAMGNRAGQICAVFCRHAARGRLELSIGGP